MIYPSSLSDSFDATKILFDALEELDDSDLKAVAKMDASLAPSMLILVSICVVVVMFLNKEKHAMLIL